MKKLIPIIFILCFCIQVKAQTITHANFFLWPKASAFRSIELEINHEYYIGLSNDGQIDYITTKDGVELFDGDCKRLGIPIKYYNQFDIHDIQGRVKSIGNIMVKYNNVFDIHDEKGSLKSIGNISIKYYNVFDIHDPKGKVKSIGDVKIQYYNAFDDLQRFGQIKSIAGNGSGLVVRGWRRFNRDFEE